MAQFNGRFEIRLSSDSSRIVITRNFVPVRFNDSTELIRALGWFSSVQFSRTPVIVC